MILPVTIVVGASAPNEQYTLSCPRPLRANHSLGGRALASVATAHGTARDTSGADEAANQMFDS